MRILFLLLFSLQLARGASSHDVVAEELSLEDFEHVEGFEHPEARGGVRHHVSVPDAAQSPGKGNAEEQEEVVLVLARASKPEPVVEVSWDGNREVVSKKLLDEIHQKSGNRVFALITECVHDQNCEDQVRLWSNRLLNLKRLNHYGVDKWKLIGAGFRGPLERSSEIWQYTATFTR